MIRTLAALYSSLLHLFFPNNCECCSQDLTAEENILCLSCRHQLPETSFEQYTGNPVEHIFQGRVNIQHAAAVFYYTHPSPLQHLVYQFKYKQRKDIALYMGRQMGLQLLKSPWIQDISLIVPVPLHAGRKRKRGYNQSALLADGISAVIRKPVMDMLARTRFRQSQTLHNRETRWKNVEQAFRLKQTSLHPEEHILLIDDVITTGATSEACCHELLRTGAKVSICSLSLAIR